MATIRIENGSLGASATTFLNKAFKALKEKAESDERLGKDALIWNELMPHENFRVALLKDKIRTAHRIYGKTLEERYPNHDELRLLGDFETEFNDELRDYQTDIANMTGENEHLRRILKEIREALEPYVDYSPPPNGSELVRTTTTAAEKHISAAKEALNDAIAVIENNFDPAIRERTIWQSWWWGAGLPTVVTWDFDKAGILWVHNMNILLAPGEPKFTVPKDMPPLTDSATRQTYTLRDRSIRPDIPLILSRSVRHRRALEEIIRLSTLRVKQVQTGIIQGVGFSGTENKIDLRARNVNRALKTLYAALFEFGKIASRIAPEAADFLHQVAVMTLTLEYFEQVRWHIFTLNVDKKVKIMRRRAVEGKYEGDAIWEKWIPYSTEYGKATWQNADVFNADIFKKMRHVVTSIDQELRRTIGSPIDEDVSWEIPVIDLLHIHLTEI
jgi:hypothetical protein